MIKKLLDPWRAYQRIRQLPPSQRRIVFYSEGRECAVFFQPILDALQNVGREYLYVTSDPGDPLAYANTGGEAFVIGDGAARTAFFQTLRAEMVVTTTPDLGQFHLKRSAGVAHYAYFHHSLVSTHMAYRRGAFDHYDTILCAGPHHARETRAWEERHGLRAKKLVEHGYGPIDSLIAADRDSILPTRRDRPTILVAPSWGERGLLESCAEGLCRSLLKMRIRVILRPHPRSWRTHRRLIEALAGQFGADVNFTLDEGTASHEIYREADLMVSDWSGAAFEFAFGLARPVLFVDVAKKINNPDYRSIDCEPAEVSLRHRVGVVLPAAKLAAIGPMVEQLLGEHSRWRRRIIKETDNWVFNVGSSGAAAADFLARPSGPTVCGRAANESMRIIERTLEQRVSAVLLPQQSQVEALLAALLERPNANWTEEERATLHQLARKIEVTKRLCSEYPPSWSQPEAAKPLRPQAWPAVVALFLRAADGAADNLKFLNAALRALDAMAAAGQNHFAGELRRHAEALLARVA